MKKQEKANETAEVTNTSTVQKTENVKHPIDILKPSYMEKIKEFKKELCSLQFRKDLHIELCEKYKQPEKSYFFVDIYNKIFELYSVGDSLTLSLIGNLNIIDGRKIIEPFNDDSNTEDNVYCSLDLMSETGHLFKNVEFKGFDLLEAKEFQKRLCKLDPSLRLEISNKNFPIFLQEIVIPKFKKKLIKPVNSGVLEPQVFLAGNALISKGRCTFANEDGIIIIDENTSIKANDKISMPLPHIYESNRTAQEIAKELLQNLFECWSDNIVLALMPLGHMIMAPFYTLFLVKGVSSLLLWGKSGSGKSTIVKVGLALFGLGKDFLKAGSTTVRSFEDLTYQFNGMNICIDDLDPDLLCSKKFVQIAKSAFEGQARGRLVKGPDNKYRQDSKKAFSQLVYSTNKPLPDIEELRNRMSVYTIMKGAFNEKSFKYFDKDIEKRQELSLILPELMKFTHEDVINLYQHFEQYFSEQLRDVEQRIICNLAYDCTGAYLLQQIAGYEIPDFNLKLLDYARDTIESYREIPTPVDVLLNSLLALKTNGIICEDHHYRIFTQDFQTFLRFHKETLISTHNKYFSGEPAKKIKMSEFNAYLKNDKRFVRNISVRYKYSGEENQTSAVLNITNWDDVVEFVKPTQKDSSEDKTSNNT